MPDSDRRSVPWYPLHKPTHAHELEVFQVDAQEAYEGAKVAYELEAYSGTMREHEVNTNSKQFNVIILQQCWNSWSIDQTHLLVSAV